jgi:hypothetical protein
LKLALRHRFRHQIFLLLLLLLLAFTHVLRNHRSCNGLFEFSLFPLLDFLLLFLE